MKSEEITNSVYVEKGLLAGLVQCFLGFTGEPEGNMQRITASCGKLMEAGWALYNRMQDDGMLHTLAHWNAPHGFRKVSRAEGRVCHDVIIKGGREVFVVRDLPETDYARTIPLVSALGIKTYMGAPVSVKGSCIGSLCMFYLTDHDPSREELQIMQIMATALGVEEERKEAIRELRRSKARLELLVQERTQELVRLNEQLQKDIVEKREAEESLRKSENILRKIFEASPDLLAVIDRDYRVIHCNWDKKNGIGHGKDNNRPPLCYITIHPGQKEPCKPCHCMEVFKSGKSKILELSDPVFGEVEVRAFPIFDDSGNVVMVAENIRDIGERKRDHAVLLEQHEKLRAITETASDAIVMMDNEGRISFWNPAAVKIFGHSVDEAMGRELHAFLAPAHYYSRYKQGFKEFSESGKGKAVGKTLELKAVKKDGSEFSLELSLSGLQIDGKWHAAGILRDITERKQVEEKLRKTNETLKAKSRELLEAQEELVRKEKLAVLGQLSGSVGHELRNPLGIINNAVYFLNSVVTQDDGIVREYMDIIKQEIDNSLRIIEDLLDFTRTKVPEKLAVPVGQLIENSIARCHIPGVVELTSDIPHLLPLVHVDPLQMAQVFGNLLSNAVQAMPEGGALNICARQSGPMVEVSVSDTGMGITPESMTKIFLPLFTTKSKGIGLGLVIAKNLTQANGGQIEVASRPGEGTRFTLFLPALTE